MTIVDNCGDVPIGVVNPETGLFYNTSDEIKKNRSYITCVVFNIDLELGNIDLKISDAINGVLGTVNSLIANAIAQSESRTNTTINNAIDGLRSESQSADSNLQTQITNNNNVSNQVDTQLFNYTQGLHNQQQGYINQQDQNILQQAYGFTSNQVNQVYDYITGQVNDIYSDIETIYQYAAKITDSIGKFIDDPLGWLLKFLTDVFIPWIMDEVAGLIAPETNTLPPRENYGQLYEIADL